MIIAARKCSGRESFAQQIAALTGSFSPSKCYQKLFKLLPARGTDAAACKRGGRWDCRQTCRLSLQRGQPAPGLGQSLSPPGSVLGMAPLLSKDLGNFCFSGSFGDGVVSLDRTVPCPPPPAGFGMDGHRGLHALCCHLLLIGVVN